MKINVKEILSVRARISYLQICILILSSFAFSYLIYMASSDNIIIDNKTNEKNFLTGIFEFIINQIKKPLLPMASADTLNCCPLEKTGALCSEFPSSECSGKCASSCLPLRCSEASQCKLGCCYDPAKGSCASNSAKGSCESAGGQWTDSANCDFNKAPDCRLGCCVFGNNAEFVTSRECENLASSSGMNVDFRAGITNEIECLALSKTQENGACVFNDKSCKTTTGSDCINLRGVFHSNRLCTDTNLNTNCKPTKQTTCVSGKDEVYFVDSCGNIANIYDSGKINDADYWSRVYSKEESCNNGQSNINSGCGNCNYESKCKSSGSSNVCTDMNCKNAIDNNGKTKDRKNGESWCVFDGAIGNGQDLVGSRYYKYSCVDGEVKTEPCADFRNEICVQKDIAQSSGTISTASCRINNWQSCLDGTGCGQNTDCYSKTIKLSKEIPAFNVCLPNYPPGFDLQDGGDSAQAICGQANFKCTVVYQKKLSGWKCVGNCDCEKAAFAEQMHEWCASLGDCGFKMNVAGQAAKSFVLTGKKAKDSTKAIGSLTWTGNYPEPGSSSEISGNGQETEIPSGEADITNSSWLNAATMWGVVPGALGVALRWGSGTVGAGTPMVVGFGNAFIAAGIGAVVGGIAAKLFGLSDDASILVSVVGAGAGFAAVAYSGWQLNALWGMAGIVALAVTIILALLLYLLGIGKTKNYYVEFKCNPWQPPVGGTDCDKCNDGKCSKYKCQSLGTSCQFINEGSSNELCISAKDDATAPRISPWINILDKNFSYNNITDAGFNIVESNGDCIQAFTPLTFGIQTDKAAQCKIFDSHTSNFDAMENFFGDSNLFSFNHSDSIQMLGASFDEEMELSNNSAGYNLGNARYYVRCQDVFGNYNLAEFTVNICIRPGPDKTPPIIMKTIPENNAVIKYNQTSQNISLFLNEPADCKYGRENRNYSSMENSFVCGSQSSENTCLATLTNLSDENSFYFRCKDHPELAGANESERNENSGYLYNIGRSKNPLTISNLVPNGTLNFGSEPISVNLELDTSGGVNGAATCSYSFDSENYTDFFNTMATHHKQVFNQMIRGDYIIYIKCKDSAGNTAESTARFSLNVDNTAPIVTRAYNLGGSLYIFTNKDSECAYSFGKCGFIFENGTLMSGGFAQQHSADWQTDKTYYIKCRDAWNNEPTACSIKIKAYNSLG